MSDGDGNQMLQPAPTPIRQGGLHPSQLSMESSASRALGLIGRRFEAIGKISQSFGHRAHGSDRLLAHLRNYRIVHIGNGMAQFHLDQFDGLFDAAAYAARARWRI